MTDKIKTLEGYYKDNYGKLVKGWSRRAGSPENAEDLVQEAFTRALQYIEGYNEDTPFEGWFITILHNCWKSQAGDAYRQGMSITIEDADEQGLLDEVEITDDNRRLISIIRRMIKNSRRPAKDILYLHFVREWKPSEISHYLNIELETVKKSLYRFKQTVASSFGHLKET